MYFVLRKQCLWAAIVQLDTLFSSLCTLGIKYKVGMAVQKSEQTRVAGITVYKYGHPSYIYYQSVSDFMKDVGISVIPATLVCSLFCTAIPTLFTIVFFIRLCCWSVCVSENDLYLLILRVCTAIKFTTFNLNIFFSLTDAQWLMLFGNQYLIDTLLEPDDVIVEFQLVVY